MSDWALYADQKPAREGVFEWRVPSRVAPTATLQFCAHMRKRGAGHSDTISPSFDHWDGYKVHVPAGTMWRETDSCADLKEWAIGPVGVVDREIAPCRFCGNVHRLTGVERAASGGLFVTSDPHRLNSWRLEPCAWATTPRFGSPLELIDAWNARHAQGIAAGTDETPQEVRPEGQEPGRLQADAPPNPLTPKKDKD